VRVKRVAAVAARQYPAPIIVGQTGAPALALYGTIRYYVYRAVPFRVIVPNSRSRYGTMAL